MSVALTPKWLLLLGLALPVAAAAQQAASARKPADSACVDVEVNGYRALSYECLNAQIAPAPNAPRDNPALASQDIVSRPGNQIGQFNRAATSNRMGNTFGASARPQRPPRP